MNQRTTGGPDDPTLDNLRGVTVLVYLLQAVALLLAVTVLVAVVINYVKRDDARGTWLESHFRWQIRTFWYSVLWTVLGTLTAAVGIGYVILLASYLWYIYRVAKGWLWLNDRREMYVPR